MYEYSICNQVDAEIYRKQCAALESHVPGLEKEKELIDVDGSAIQGYNLHGKRITVHNSFYANEVYVKSEVELGQYFK